MITVDRVIGSINFATKDYGFPSKTVTTVEEGREFIKIQKRGCYQIVEWEGYKGKILEHIEVK